jgi:hypothetical protein
MSAFEPDDRLSALLDELGPEEPPPTLARDVMARIPALPHRGAAPVLRFTKGQPMTRKIIWGVAAAAAVALAVFSVKGFPPTGAGTEGTIGAAKRYQAPQLSEKDVTLGDASAQEFMQSDTFARLLKDPAAVKLLSDAKFVAQVKDANVRFTLANPDLSAFIHALHSELIPALVRADVATALKRDDVIAALKAGDLAAAVQKGDLNAAVSDSAIKALLTSADLVTALHNDVFVHAIQNTQVIAALSNPVFAGVIADSRLGAALASGVLQNAIASNGFFTAVQSQQFAAQLASNVHAQ